MSSPRPSRFPKLAPSLLFAALLFSAACATGPQRPPATISTGSDRVDPEPRSLGEPSDESVDQAALGDIDSEGLEPLDDGYTPAYMVGRELRRLAVLLPFSHPNANVRREAEGILAGIELALFNAGDTDVLVLPKDTGGTATGAQEQMQTALEERADIVIGPLFSANVQAVRPLAQEAGVPVIAFSNSPEAAGDGAFLISIAPEEEVRRLVDFATRQGITTFAFLGPANEYGRRMEAALQREAAVRGAFVVSSAVYSPSNDAPVDEAKLVADTLLEIIDPTGQRFLDRDERDPREPPTDDQLIGVLVPERGVKLRGVAPLLPYFGVDTRWIRLLGPSSWNDETLWREPTLDGSFFAAPSNETLERFNEAYARNYNSDATTLSSLGYDATALAVQLTAEDGGLTMDSLTDPDGFIGINGLFRFREDGTSERGLAIFTIDTNDGAEEVEPALETFSPPTG